MSKLLSKIKSKHKTFFLRIEAGFTLVEMAVVMTIVAVIVATAAIGMISANKEARFEDAVKTLQATLKEAANNSITVSPDLADPTKTAKAWAIRVDNTQKEYYLEDYYFDAGGINLGAKSIPSAFAKDITVEVMQTNDPEGGGGTFTPSSIVLYVFSSPFADFTAVNGEAASSAWIQKPKVKSWHPDPTESTVINPALFPSTKIKVSNGVKDKFITVNSATGEATVGTE